MKGVIVVVIVLAIALMGGCSIVLANPPLVPPVQYEQFCENQKVAGTGVIDVSTSIIDKKIALEYFNTMAGNGDLEMDGTHVYSQDPEKIAREVAGVNGGNKTGFNLVETNKMTYSGKTPLVGGKLLNSKAFYGGIGAQAQEMFSVNEMEKDETAFFASTTPYNPTDIKKKCRECEESRERCQRKLHECKQDCTGPHAGECREKCEECNKCDCIRCPPECNRRGPDCEDHQDKCDPKKHQDGVDPVDLIGKLKEAGRNGEKVEKLMTADNGIYVPSHVLGFNIKSSFNGTWGTDAKWHKIFYKDIKAHEMFTGTFEAEKQIKFHENPVPEKEELGCEGVDC